jgi:hypothetical protein
VAHRAGPVATVVVDPGEVVRGEPGEVRAVVVDELPEDDDPPGVVDGEFEEHAPRRPPAIRRPAAMATSRECPAGPVLMDGLRQWSGTPGTRSW